MENLRSSEMIEALNFGPYFLSIREELPLNLSTQEILAIMQNRGYRIPPSIRVKYTRFVNYLDQRQLQT